MSTAFSVNTHWDVQPSTGNDNNGGSFVNGASGTDYSKQASPQYALTGISSSGSGDTVLSAAAATDMVGNGAQVISGTNFNTGFFNIISVVAGVSITFSQNAAGQSICSGVGTSGVINIGGTLNTISIAVSNYVMGNTIWIKGTYTVTATQALAKSVFTLENSGPLVFQGYGTSHGDSTRATWTTSTNSVNLIEFNHALGYVFRNIEFSNNAVTPGYGLKAKTGGNTSAVLLDNCLLHGFSNAIRGTFSDDWSFNTIVLYRCSIYSCTSHGIINDGAILILCCYIHDNGGDGYQAENQGASAGNGMSLVWRTVIKSNGGKGINYLRPTGFQGNVEGAMLVVLESDILNNTSDNIYIQNNDPNGFVLLNSINDSAGAYGANLHETYFALQLLGSIAWRNNSSGDVNNITKSDSDVTPTGDPFTDRTTADFTLNNTSGAGAACKAIGQPTIFPPA